MTLFSDAHYHLKIFLHRIFFTRIYSTVTVRINKVCVQQQPRLRQETTLKLLWDQEAELSGDQHIRRRGHFTSVCACACSRTFIRIRKMFIVEKDSSNGESCPKIFPRRKTAKLWYIHMQCLFVNEYLA